MDILIKVAKCGVLELNNAELTVHLVLVDVTVRLIRQCVCVRVRAHTHTHALA